MELTTTPDVASAVSTQQTEIEKLRAIIDEKNKLIANQENKIKCMGETQQELLRYKKKLERNESIYILSTQRYIQQGIFKISRTICDIKIDRSLEPHPPRQASNKVVVVHEYKVNDSKFMEENICAKMRGLLLVASEPNIVRCPYDKLKQAIDKFVEYETTQNSVVANVIDIVYQLRSNPAEWKKRVEEDTDRLFA
jgi:hypothetical protein